MKSKLTRRQLAHHFFGAAAVVLRYGWAQQVGSARLAPDLARRHAIDLPLYVLGQDLLLDDAAVLFAEQCVFDGEERARDHGL